jgi:hypothetical protein
MADLLRWPVIGRVLRWRHARTVPQLILLAAAVVVVLHGFFGPALASENLATVLVWVHYRGLLVVALLAAGNAFCAGCPFILVRDWGRRLHRPVRHWPARWRGKWMAAALFAVTLFAYELFDLWALPRVTAMVVLAYFAAALTVDLCFRGASFCKHVCPVGQFNFAAATVSPLELRVREPATCAVCPTTDCISGRYVPATAPRVLVQRGCELGLFLPAKIGNLDCTFCLDCVHACPHDNVALATRPPGAELADPGRRSGIGRLAGRPDLALLAVLFVFGGLLNAFAMTAPATRTAAALAQALGGVPEPVLLGSLFLAGLVVLPALLVGGAAALTSVEQGRPGVASVALRYVPALLPVGVGVWFAHYGFHLLTGALVIVPVTQSAAADLAGFPVLGDPLWRWAGLAPGAVLPMQIGAVLLGAMGSISVTVLVATIDHPGHALRAAAPWAILTALVAAAALWIMGQPMDMRGLSVGG